MTRIAPQAGERIDRAGSISFTFDGKPVAAFPGDTIASALFASGQRIFSRSFKYHRPRGLLTGDGQDPNALVGVDGYPGVRAGGEPARDGMVVTHLNAWPSLRFDVMRASDHLGPLLPPGFYYKTFIRPRALWPLYEKVLRNAAGLGTLPPQQDDREWRTEYRRRHCDVLVVGGGIAGLSAALRAAELGADVVLADEDVEPGGLQLVEGGHERARALAAQAKAAGVEILSKAAALGSFDGLFPVWQGNTLHQVRAARAIAATGAIEQPLIFSDNDLPGVMLAGGARRLGSLYGLRVGETAVVATTGDRGLDAALALHAQGVRIAAVADLRQDADGPLVAALEGAGIEYLRGATVVRAHGGRRVRAAALARVDDHGHVIGAWRKVACDLLAVSGGVAPASSLLLQAGGRARFDAVRGRFLPGDLPAGIHAAGAVVGHDSAEAAALSGQLAGERAALALGFGAAAQTDIAAVSCPLADIPVSPPDAIPPAHATDGKRGKAFVDLDEDVTVKDIAYAAAEGYDSIELSKRYTTATMGPSQGRFSQLGSVRALAAHTSLSMADVGLTTARPPWTTVPLGALAGRPFEAAKRSAMHGRHREMGATVRWAGDWRRAYDYGDPEGEALAVHTAAGLIDVSSLGKLLVRGPEAAEFLDRLYPNRMSTVAPGKVRYGVIVSEAGRITDDGTVVRLDDETFYITTTSSGAAGVEQLFGWWLAVWEMDVTITDLTQVLAAVNLAGPRAREILSSITDLDIDNDAFPYLGARQGRVAGIDCLVLRIGFTGEPGYEIHAPATLGEPLWDALLEAGTPIGLRPFGLEPQRILRLQKQHILVGQDTDSETTPYGANLGWTVKLDKAEAFIGKWALAHSDSPCVQLVGFTVDGTRVPTEGAAVLDRAGRPAGQVTSARRSPQLDAVIGLAQVPAEAASDGATFTISDGDRRLVATTVTAPFYDPDGVVLRA